MSGRLQKLEHRFFANLLEHRHEAFALRLVAPRRAVQIEVRAQETLLGLRNVALQRLHVRCHAGVAADLRHAPQNRLKRRHQRAGIARRRVQVHRKRALGVQLGQQRLGVPLEQVVAAEAQQRRHEQRFQLSLRAAAAALLPRGGHKIARGANWHVRAPRTKRIAHTATNQILTIHFA